MKGESGEWRLEGGSEERVEGEYLVFFQLRKKWEGRKLGGWVCVDCGWGGGGGSGWCFRTAET